MPKRLGSSPRLRRATALASAFKLGGFAAALLVFAASADAQVYKCKRGGVIAYQDKPCPPGTHLGKITLEAPPAPGKSAPSSIRPPDPVSATPPASAAPDLLPPAQNYLCERYNGSTYFTASNMPKRYYVSASQLKKPRPNLKPGSSLWVTDECKIAPISDACAHYAAQILANDKKLQTADAAEKKKLIRDSVRIRTVANSRCRIN